MDVEKILQRRLAEATVIPQSTELAYRRAVRRLATGTPCVAGKRTHYHLRAALIWWHIDSVSKLSFAAGWPDCADWGGLQRQVTPHLAALECLRPLGDVDPGQAKSGYFGVKSISNGKRRGLGRLPTDWREQLFATVEPDDRLPVLLLAVSGCRPSELAKGIDIRRSGWHFLLGIRGAKVTADNGQPFRVLHIDSEHPWGKHLADCLSDSPAKTSYQESARSLQHRIHRLVTHWQRTTGINGYQISAYSFRHQLASDLKRQGEPDSWIAAVLGHRSTRTSTGYGSWQQGKAGQGGLIQSVAVMHAPRQWPSTFQASTVSNHRIVIIPGGATAESTLPSPGLSNTVTTSSRSSHQPGRFLS